RKKFGSKATTIVFPESIRPLRWFGEGPNHPKASSPLGGGRGEAQRGRACAVHKLTKRAVRGIHPERLVCFYPQPQPSAGRK
ncbi:hypothetical protein P4H67_04840, partial [Paenibacillus lautus]|uniref:hypothetical protein n=1 Tax=Paenibacillus lautus TaxID=1401 RepID=UPI002DBA92B6